jgi:formate-dependent nitrite reductase membrane component NrfD
VTDAGDGRNIDTRFGILEGEGADQRAPHGRASTRGTAPFDAWSGHSPEDDSPSYYDRPVLKEPVWIWAVPVYFWIGGAAGAASVIGAGAQMVDAQGYEALVARARRLAALGSAVGSALLIHDLGRPERFLNMLRVFRPTSALSMGSWTLAASTSISGLAAITARSGPRFAADATGILAGLVGLPQSGYTAVLLSDTAVPLWQSARKSLPLLFVASALASASDLLQFGTLGKDQERVVHRLGLIGKLGELVAIRLVERDAHRIERVGSPLKEGLGGSLWTAAKGLTAAALAGSLVAKGRKGRVATALLGTAGALALRFAVFHAGKASARDPRAVFEQQRSGEGH